MKMPDLATTDSPIKLVRWLVELGQPVKRGQPLLEIETDKAMSEVESIATGVLKEVRVRPDDMVSVGQVIAVFEVASALSGSTQVQDPPPAPNQIAPASAAAPVKIGGMFARNRASAGKGVVAKSVVGALSANQRTVGRRHASQQAKHSAFLFADFC